MIIDYKKVRSISTEPYKKDFNYDGYTAPLDNTHQFADERGNNGEHYKLLTYLSNMFDGITILDVGTNWGDSAISLSQNKNNKVISYDIMHIWNFPFAKDYANLEFKLMDINDEDPEIIKSAKLIFFDIAHDGVQEQKFTDMLERIGYKGYVLCDDINLPWAPWMKVWWDGLQIEKYDITDIGHTWGTGLLNYYQDGNIQIIK